MRCRGRTGTNPVNNNPVVYAFAALTIVLFGFDAAMPGHVALHVAWHLVAYVLLTLIPGQLPVSVDDPDYYYERRRRWRQERRVAVPPNDLGDWSPDYPGLYIPKGHNRLSRVDHETKHKSVSIFSP